MSRQHDPNRGPEVVNGSDAWLRKRNAAGLAAKNPAAIAQREMQASIDNSPRIQQQQAVIQAVKQKNKQTNKKKGKEGGSYFNRDGYTAEQIKKAEEKVGQTSAHGSGKGGVSGISGKTLKEEKDLVKELQAIKAQEYKDSRPKANTYETAPSSDFERALAQASTTYYRKQEELDAYIEQREYQFSNEELDDLYAAAGLS